MNCAEQVKMWFYLCLALCGVILAMLAMFFGYNLKLGTRTAQLEKKNGKEQKQLDQLKERRRQRIIELKGKKQSFIARIKTSREEEKKNQLKSRIYKHQKKIDVLEEKLKYLEHQS